MGYAIKYTRKNNEILKDGHTMFKNDIVKELNRLSFLEFCDKSNSCVVSGCGKYSTKSYMNCRNLKMIEKFNCKKYRF